MIVNFGDDLGEVVRCTRVTARWQTIDEEVVHG